MRVFGIDPGSQRTGWGVVERQGSRMRLVAAGVIGAGRGELAERLCIIADTLDELLDVHLPEVVAVEAVFHAKNARSALQLGHARGVALLCAGRRKLQVFEYTAAQVKKATTGHGGADKSQVQRMVRAVLGPEVGEALDASDALACAICHAQMHSTPNASLLRNLMTEARRPKRRAVSR